MKPVIKLEGSVGRLVLVGPFDFNMHKDFRQASQSLLDEPGVEEILVDFEQVPFLDSSALGMLLLLKERAAAQKRTLALINCRDTVKQVLEIACFNKMFVIR
ncbi:MULTISPECIES: STAS domain-containing protein [Gulbenkiania]|uniref:Anti-anti-sigma regulatory factor (Antagonist of anti-sigma factor) n=1 Tax=Gulbenkiania indica TaxID=375574 RepID=A0A0K6GRS0_9NEIS|nr:MULTISPECIES: STAS domain-containing protein [Gulbenkiania]CUA81454.1 Anti-anti-sigma regulatory factor (antagonist of anti-sigma factor) [Gulbenkiania indica]